MYSSRGGRNIWVLIIMMLVGVVVGGFIGEYIGRLPNMSWLTYGEPFGLKEPLLLNLGIIELQFGLVIHFTISGILGIALAAFLYKKVL